MVTGQRLSCASAGLPAAASSGFFSSGGISRPITVSVLNTLLAVLRAVIDRQFEQRLARLRPHR